MKKIVFINPYFGKFPDYFELWLHSCRYNESIDWIIFTDNYINCEVPENVKIYNISFDEMKQMLQKCFDFPINLNNPYKLCDYKPVYGLAFKELISDYDFWGYCDMDLIFGNIRKFITDDILNKYTKILRHGHFTLIKNDIRCNNFFQMRAKGQIDYKTVYTSDAVYSFDEWGGVTPILDFNGVEQYYANIFADISFCYDFLHLMFIDSDYVPQVFIWEEGKLYRKFYNKFNIYEQEFLYIHLQKRTMRMKFEFKEDLKKFMIGPHSFFIDDSPINYESLTKMNPFKLFYFYWIKRRAKEMTKQHGERLKVKFLNLFKNK